MCGILITSGLKRAFHHRQLTGLKKRGPDEIGYWIDDRVQIGHTRLSIIGLDERSTEPLENDTHVLAFNGEIYNFIALRERLSGQGILLPGANDAAVLLHAWSRSGPEILKELDGFWAFAIYDKRSHVVTLVRDQLVHAGGEIEEIARRDARRILIVALGIRRRDADTR